jgi:hypothetical protein
MILPGWFLRAPRSGSTPHDDDRRRTAEPALPPPRIRPKFDRFLAHEHKDVGDGLSLSSSSSSRSLARAQAGRSAVVGVSRVGPAQQASQDRPLRCWQQSGSQEERVVSLLLPVVSPRTTLLDGRHARGRASSSVRAVRAEGRAAASSGIVQRHPMRVLLQSSSQRVVCRGGRPRVGLPCPPYLVGPHPFGRSRGKEGGGRRLLLRTREPSWLSFAGLRQRRASAVELAAAVVCLNLPELSSYRPDPPRSRSPLDPSGIFLWYVFASCHRPAGHGDGRPTAKGHSR